MWFFEIFIVGILVYIFVVFGLAQFVVPNLRRVKTPKEVGEELKQIIEETNRTAASDLEFVKTVLFLLRQRFFVKPGQIFITPWILFRKDVDRIWTMTDTNQCCTVLNLLLRTFLVKSGRFKEEDLEDRRCILGVCIHQYLLVRMKSGASMPLDPWGYLAKRIPPGEHAHGFFLPFFKRPKNHPY
ncbi:MAG: hypothetical protein HYW89_01320 [Candidatus Sungiibacteriota bacterium]|uniref:Uncharacterized protein n=1 Tax=Candidatus Sungiibacteriota bacterium TaxID=2750080 RepID=A0A7T5RKT8_9BACT|nr:MAG: hypothetical protein HYW89_01320 [Candidatus Sungbacteria bacterium]